MTETQRPVHAAVVVPLINTGPLTDICLSLILLPLWWVLGLEQFVPVLLVLLASMKVIWLRDHVTIHPVLVGLALFVVVQCVSALFIVEPFRYVSFFRNLSMYLMALATLFVLLNTIRTPRHVYLVLASIVVCLTFSALAGLLAAIGLVRPEFTSFAGRILPDFIARTDYAQQIVQRQLGDSAWFRGLGNYFRVDGFFLYSTTYAAALALTLPIAAWLTRTTWGLRRALFALTFVAMAANLVLTTGRGAILAVCAAALYPLYTNARLVVKAMLVTIGLVLIAIAVAVVPSETVTEGVRSVVLARGEGSAVSRLTIYTHTFDGFKQRPIFGWGTERDLEVEGFAYPAGSHSDLLGVLYKHGLVGFGMYVLLWVGLWVSSRPRLRHGALLALSSHLRWSLLAGMAISFITVISLDTMLMLVFWVIAGTAAAVSRLNLGTTQDLRASMLTTARAPQSHRRPRPT